jgi:hypothetical protein
LSHTTKVKVEFLDTDALGAAVIALGGTVLGEGSWRLYQGYEVGFGFRLQGWQYPCVLTGEELKFDTYNGRWGNEADLSRLNTEYALSVSMKAAQAQGWYCERSQDSVIIHHPDGGVITVTSQGVDASQFLGADCVSACAPIEGAIGSQSERTLKNEFYQTKQTILNRGE